MLQFLFLPLRESGVDVALPAFSFCLDPQAFSATMTTMPTPKRRRCIDFTDSSTVRLSEVIGDATRPVAQLLALLDVTAGRCGFRHARSGVVTGCFDVIDVLAPVRSGDIVTSVGSILAVGSRSMLIQVDAYVEPRVVTTPLAAPTHIIS